MAGALSRIPTAGTRCPTARCARPTLRGYRRAGWTSLSEEQKTGFPPVCPEFVIELRSPSDKLADLQAKMEMWIANGAEVAWLIDPLEKAVSIYRPGEQPEVLAQPTSVQGTGPIAGFELVLARIWA